MQQKKISVKTIGYSQDIGDDPQGPHVGAVTDGLKVDHFRSHKLRGPEQNLAGEGLMRQCQNELQKEYCVKIKLIVLD